MKYEKNQYSESFSICTLIIAGGFLYWGISSFIPWDEWSWWGFISIGIGLAILLSQIFAITNRSKLKNVVLSEFQENPEASVEQVSKSTGISRKDIQAIVLDLKASGQLRAKFNSETGQVKHLVKDEPEVAPGEMPKFCSNCGTPITKESAQYCAYCGGKI
ncbi:MAG: hypothetical protein ACFE8B_06685 [Candidatus Hermodarchaeota archaeon]